MNNLDENQLLNINNTELENLKAIPRHSYPRWIKCFSFAILFLRYQHILWRQKIYMLED